jgi:uncharacterized protein YndB with AHSA1/START domain
MSKTPDKELILTRVLNAPRRLVWEAWTTQAALRQWWGPKHFTLPVCELDFRVGGAYRWVMRGPDGNDYPMQGTFLEIVTHERIVFRAILDDEEPDHEIMTTVTFATQKEQTLLTMRQTYYKVAEMKTNGAPVGWNQSLDRLAEYLDGKK